MPRNEQVFRHWNLLRKLQTRGAGFTLDELARQFRVSQRTIQRDLETLRRIGFPIEFDADEFGKRFWRLPADFFRSGPLTLSFTEALALHLAHSLIQPLAGTPLADAMHDVMEKIRSMLPPEALDHFAGLDEIIYIRRPGAIDYTPHGETIRLLTEAARTARSVEVTYHALSHRQRYTTRLDPYGLVLYDGDLFVIGHSHRAGQVRIFKVSRILDARRTSAAFSRPPGFDPDRHFRHSFGIFQSHGEPIEIVVRFTGIAAHLVEERIWHESQQITHLAPEAALFDQPDDAGVEVTFRLANVVEFKRWIMGFGDQAEVLRPQWLRRQIRDELLSAARRYGP